MGALVQGFINFLKLQAINKVRQGAADDRLGDRENRKKLAARAFLEGYEPDPRLFAKGSDDAPDVVVPDPLVGQTETALPPQAPVAPQLVPVGPGPSVVGENEYIVRQIERIDQNVMAIALAMEQNVRSDAEYRQSVIESQRESLARRGGLRSKRRQERRRGFFSKLVETAGAPVQRLGGRLRAASKEVGKGLLGFAALQAIDRINKSYEDMKSQVMEFLRNTPGIGRFFGEPEPEPTPDTGGDLTPSSGAANVSGVDVGLLADATGFAEGTYGSIGPYTYDPMGYGLGRYQFMTGRADVQSTIRKTAMEEGVSEKELNRLFDAARKGGASGDKASKQLLTYFPQESQDELFRQHVQNTLARIKKKYPNATPEFLVQKFGVYHLTGGDHPDSADVLGTTGKMHGDKILEEYSRLYNERLKKMQPQKVNFVMPDASKPGAPAGGGYKIGDIISYLDPIIIDQTTKKANKEPGAGMSPGFDVASAVMDPSLGRSVYEPLLGIGVG